MPHIHIQPDQHDMTVSAYIMLREADEWKYLVHFHRKMDVLMQVGGHIELDETPWQAMANELRDEAGYALSELKVLQHTADSLQMPAAVVHPAPILSNTHSVGDDHYHSDLTYGFVASARPERLPQEGESADLRWLTLQELEAGGISGEVLADVVSIYQFMSRHIDTYARISADEYSLDKPAESLVTYKRGRPGQPR